MKKIIKYLPVFLLLPLFASCSNTSDEEGIVLNVYNTADYILEDEEDAPGMIKQFEAYCLETFNTKVTVKYSTFETNEDMYNQLKAGGVQYDLVCTSEYMIGKMIQNDMLEPLTGTLEEVIPNYYNYGSKYIRNIYDNIEATSLSTNTTYKFDKFTVPYMWGTMGFLYDPSKLSEEDVSSWDLIWNTDYANKSSLKDSIRDSYAVTALYVYKTELELAKQVYGDDVNAYNAKITEIMNRCDDKTLSLVEAALKEAKKNIYEFEVDEGKENIVKGKYYANVSWSGDAVFAMDEAEDSDNPFYLNYMVPAEGSNLWFDGWVMPKNANTLWAQRFVDFLCNPTNAMQNMDYVGYSSAIAGQDIWELVLDWYDCSDSDDATPYDLTYFFEGNGIVDGEGNEIEDFIIMSDEEFRQLYAQFPDAETISRCAIMKDFGDQNEKVNEMWIRVKGNDTSWVIVVFIVAVIGLVGFFEAKSIIANRARKRRTKTR